MARINARMNVYSVFYCVCFLIVLFAMTGCTMRTLLYRNSSLLIKEALDDRFDLTGEQEDEVEARLEALLEWHRSTELPGISSDLGQVEKLIDPEPSEATPERDKEAVRVFFSALVNRRQTLQDRLWPELASFLRGLSLEQRKSYLKSQEERWEKWSKRLNMTAEDYLEDRKDRMNEQIEAWFGRLSDPQEKLIEEFVTQQRPTDVLQLELSQASTRWLFDRLALNPDKDTAVLALLDAAFLMRQGRNPTERQLINGRIANYQTLITALLRVAKTGQRQHLKEEIRALQEDVDELTKHPLKEPSRSR